MPNLAPSSFQAASSGITPSLRDVTGCDEDPHDLVDALVATGVSPEEAMRQACGPLGPGVQANAKQDTPPPSHGDSHGIPFTPRFSALAHVGDLNRPRSPHGTSFEGGGLSVSFHPEAWTRIAKLGGYPTWTLRKENPSLFEVPSPLPAGVTDWCVSQGFLEPARKFRVSWWDEEDDDERYFEFDTLEEAQAEADDEEGRSLEEVDGWRFGPRGIAYWKDAFGESSRVSHAMAEDYAPIFWAEAMGYDGCWWDEELDPERLSAPRGVIFQSRLAEWSRALGWEDFPEDDDEWDDHEDA